MEEGPIKRVVIAGGGTAGWIAAAVLSKALGKQLDITLIESDQIPTVGVGEATIPALQTLHQILELDEREFMKATNATFKLGISFENWRDLGHKYFHSFGGVGKGFWACDFVHFWLAGVRHGLNAQYGDYCLEHLAAREDKFALVRNATVRYAYHLDAGLYAALLRSKSESMGVHRLEGKIDRVNVNPHNGFIDSLGLESGELVAGDLFIDCTGFRSLLLGETLQVGYEDWSHWLPCDRALAVQTETHADPVPYTRSIAHRAGWQWQIPLQNRVGNGLVYAGRYIGDEQARELLMSHLPGPARTEPKLINFQTGSRRKHWHKNCVALGLASSFLEPLESTSIHLIQKGALRLTQLFPTWGIHASDVDEFNEQTRVDVERIRDFIILHYKVTNRTDSEFWRYCKDMEIPEELAHRIRLFQDSGRVFKRDHELFSEESWIQVMLGQGITPEHEHPIAAAMSDNKLAEFLDVIRTKTRQRVDKLPSHEEFLRHYCS